MTNIPVITIDGPSGSGKGTIAQLLAKKLHWHFLDSGVLYRVIGWAVLQNQVDPSDLNALQNLINHIKIEMKVSEISDDPHIFCDNQEVTSEIRSEACSQMASITSAIPLVRTALLDRQRAMRKAPGLVTDGRDMGTVVFPDAILKFYITASLDERANRRFNQLKAKGKNVNLRDIHRELQVRDERDQTRAISPTKPANDAITIDTTNLNIESVLKLVLQDVKKRGF
ncbi:MAG TPA: (d)CMP kinase [Coxiellaceae bacterium]|nr:MAG: cytidylate kinase [Gammaproteobacteria bacterium RIFCSPHIGHO2_12_FULL_36_30]HLB56471.1 (d)CMP kinase [Coxiellaceae bacterium]